MKLMSKKCVPCEGGAIPFDKAEIAKNLSLLKLDWEVIENRKITHLFKFRNFIQALKFVNIVGDLAEIEQHHPHIHLMYNKVRIELTTHAIKGLSENDFIMAAKIEVLNHE